MKGNATSMGSETKIKGQVKDQRSKETVMRFSRNQILGSLLILALIWIVILFRVIFSGS